MQSTGENPVGKRLRAQKTKRMTTPKAFFSVFPNGIGQYRSESVGVLFSKSVSEKLLQTSVARSVESVGVETNKKCCTRLIFF